MCLKQFNNLLSFMPSKRIVSLKCMDLSRISPKYVSLTIIHCTYNVKYLQDYTHMAYVYHCSISCCSSLQGNEYVIGLCWVLLYYYQVNYSSVASSRIVIIIQSYSTPLVMITNSDTHHCVQVVYIMDHEIIGISFHFRYGNDLIIRM